MSLFIENRILFVAGRLILLVVMLCCAVGAAAQDLAELNLDPSQAPYQATLIKTMQFSVETSRMTSYVMADLDGDGLHEMLTGEISRLLGWDCEDGYIKPRFQINLDPGWQFHHHSRTHLGTITDLNQDNVSEVHYTIRKTDRSAWRFQTVDLSTGEVTTDVPLPLGEDRRADGVWDGSYMAIGAVDAADGKGTPGIVLMRNAGYDANPRGIVVVSAHTGEIIWQWKCGPNPNTLHWAVTDLDGDDSAEIIFYGHSPDNLGGELVNGTSDDHSYLFVLSATGEELWRQELGGIFSAGTVLVADLNGDGRPEIITYTEVGRTGQTNKMTVWDFASRSQLAMVRREATFMGVAVLPGPREGTSWLVSGSNDGFITRHLYAERSLVRDRRYLTKEPHCTIVGAVDILPEPGLEILLDLNGHEFLVLNPDLKTLAVYTEEKVFRKEFPELWQRTNENLSLVVGGGKSYHILEFAEKPWHIPFLAKIVAGVFLVLLFMVTAYRLGRSVGLRGIKESAPITAKIPVADREILYRMWRQLDDVKHERFLEANRGLRRLVWLLDAYSADLGASVTLSTRIGQLLDDFVDSVQPRLAEILYLAESENFEIETVRKTARALENLGDQLGELNAKTLTMESVRSCGDVMNEELTKVEEGFLQLWQALRLYFTADPVRMLQGMLLVREVEFQRAGVNVSLVGANEVTQPGCLIDSSSLRFVLENLVDNAFRAMTTVSERELVIKVGRTDSEVHLVVSDTGKGIAPETHEHIFNGRVSDRAGGGAGLFRSREILQKWRGEIILSESGPGHGATFVVKLRAAVCIEADADNLKAPGAEA